MICLKCNTEKGFSFTKNKRSSTGFSNTCMDCYNKRTRELYLLNKEAFKHRVNKWKNNNKDAVRKIHKDYYETIKGSKGFKEKRQVRKKLYYNHNREKINRRRVERAREKRQTESLYRLKCNLRGYVNKSFNKKGYSKNSKTHEIVGCSYSELQKHLEKQFKPWMKWANYGSGYPTRMEEYWDIDHIIPISSAKNEADLIKLFHYKNLQPLDSFINRYIKKAKI